MYHIKVTNFGQSSLFNVVQFCSDYNNGIMLYFNKEMSSYRQVSVFLQRIKNNEVSTLSNKREQIGNKAHTSIP